MKLIANLLGIFIIMPIWYYLFYKILTLVGATELMWFLFWVYLPVGVFTQILTKIVESKTKGV